MNRDEASASVENRIAASWERCERQYNLVRDTAQPILRLQSSEVKPRFQEMTELIGGRQGIIRQLAEVATNAGQCLVVSDTDGILVRLESQKNDHSEFEHYGISLGSCWDERMAGTNGVAMAMLGNDAFTVRGKDHYFSKLCPFTCTATPIVDAENQKIGVINLAGIDRGSAAEYAFARQLLNATAGKINRCLFERRFGEAELVSISMPTKNALLSVGELVAVDEDGLILGSTAKAHELVGATSPLDLVGKPFEAVFGTDVLALDRLPERVVSMRHGAGAGLDISLQRRDRTVYQGRGWTQPGTAQEPRRIRRRLPPTLRELALGSKAMATILEQAQACFERALPFIVEGESGTGKSALVAALHDTAKLHRSRIVTLDCASLDDQTETRNQVAAIGGQAHIIDALDDSGSHSATLVLDNVDEMPDFGQAGLRNVLSTLETMERPLDTAMPVSALRVVAISRNPLRNSVEQGRFRDDLYYLLGEARFELPPLRSRERPEAIAQMLAVRLAGVDVEISDEALDAIRCHDWPGNVRELRSALRQALMAGDGKRISMIDLQASSAFGENRRSSMQGEACPIRASSRTYDERTMLMDALTGARWNVSRAARNLGMGRATIHRKMKRHGIARPQ